MKPTELMVGDLVLLFGDTPARVDAIGDTEVHVYEKERGDWHVGYEHVKPIPITLEILEKNGFVKTIHQDLYKNTYRLDRFFIHEHHNKVKFPYYWIDLGDTDIKYIHELQHALRLCGIEKEITI